jgi:hypothetical protein
VQYLQDFIVMMPCNVCYVCFHMIDMLQGLTINVEALTNFFNSCNYVRRYESCMLVCSIIKYSAETNLL